ncbi:hypothetical protein [Methanobrevibacter sp.]|uniref:hypothetical protein n=1 Tax=Methanobrevibacter sp. TaxID=66852 RepID=UPI0038681C1F
MDKKFISICIIALVLSIGAVSAVNLETKNFDDTFSIKVPKNSNFAVQAMDKESGFNFSSNVSLKMHVDEKNQIIVIFSDIPLISKDSADYWYQYMFQNMNPDLDSCYETQIGDMKYLKPVKESSTNFALAGINKGNDTVMVAGTDYDLVKSMGETVKFK